MNADTARIESLDPKTVWNIFVGLSAVPRPSKREEKIRAHVLGLAEKCGFAARQDDIGNIVVDVPATPGHEAAPITVLQGHLDMVPENNRDTPHDWDNDPITLVMDKDAETGLDIVRADGTTLGADNGMGVAMSFAVATTPEIVHGPLELLFTTDEEAGMTGAKELTPDSFKGRRMLNLDSEEDDAIYMGCAGGCDSNASWTFETAAADAANEACKITVTGLRGGHSGGDIHEGRGNAIRLLVRTLLLAGAKKLQLSEIAGGSKRNAIPREAHAVVTGPAGTLGSLVEAATTVQVNGIAESFEPKLEINVEKTTASQVATAEDTARLLAALIAMPCGVQGMHPKIPTLVETSNNVSIIESAASAGKVDIGLAMLSRGSSQSRLQTVKDHIVAVTKMSAATIQQGNEYPGWEPNVDSPLLATCRRIYKGMFNDEPHVAAIHAGLECGIIGKRVGDMDMVSFGPTIRGAHSPEERVFIESVGKSYKYLIAVLAELAKA